METLDLNDEVSIKLTEWGASFLNSYNESLNETCISRFRTNYKVDDIVKDQLWSIITTFKDSFRFDKEKPFNEITKV